MPTAPNPTYRQAAGFAFNRVMDLIGDFKIFVAPPNGYWHMANTLDTCLDYLLVSQTNRDTHDLTKNALKLVFDPRMQQENQPVPPERWGNWSRYEGGPWSDDYGWWGMALMRAYRNWQQLGYDETFGKLILTYAQNSLNAFLDAWDDSEAVGGSGVYGGAWNHQADPLQAFNGRNSVTNEVLWIFAQLLSEFDKSSKYTAQIGKSQEFLFEARAKQANEKGALITADGLVRERLNGMLMGDSNWTWVGDQGLFMGACLGREANSPNAPLSLVLAQAVTNKMLDKDGVLHDNIAPDLNFNDDYATGKGAFMRMWTYFQAANTTQRPSNYRNLIVANAIGAWNNRPRPNAPGNEQYQFGFNWNPAGKPYPPGEPTYPGNATNPSNFSLLVCQVAGLAAINAAVLQPDLADQQIPAKIPALAR
jgi:hypothetical protein